MANQEPVFLPSNEPYLGRETVLHFDEVIISCLDLNGKVARYTHDHILSELQIAASQIIPQGIHISLSIRELIRQGYLFGALVLIRPLMERAGIISYLYKHPDSIKVWKDDWKFGKRPSFIKLLESMSEINDKEVSYHKMYHHIVHGDPIGATWNLIKLDNDKVGYAVSKITNEPELCDHICIISELYLNILEDRMAAIFPDI